MSRPHPNNRIPPLHEIPAIIPAVREQLGNTRWDEGTPRILVVRLSPWRDVCGSTPHLVLFAEARQALPGAWIDFAFLPESRDRPILSAAGIPWFFGRDSGADPADFDLILVSISYTLELINLPYLFSTSGLAPSAPLRAVTRLPGGRRPPLSVLGGSGIACAGAVVSDEGGPGESGMVDALFFGEGEGAIGPLVAAMADHTRSREEALALAGRIDGVLVPGARSAYQVPVLSGTGIPGGVCASDGTALAPVPGIRRIVRGGSDGGIHSVDRAPVLNSVEAATTRLPISTGCPGMCTFCLEGWDRLPYREASPAEILERGRTLRESTGAETLEVYSFNFNTHRAIPDIILGLSRMYRSVSFMSQRLDILADEPALVGMETAAGKRSFSLGIEGISPALRAWFGKGLSERHLSGAFEAVAAALPREIKLFFIIAGRESEDDLAAYALLLETLSKTLDRHRASPRVVVSAGFLVRMPSTPLQFSAPVLDRRILDGIASSMERTTAARGFEFRLAAGFPEYAVDQTLALSGSLANGWLARIPDRGWVFDTTLPRAVWPSLRETMSGGASPSAIAGDKPPGWRPPFAGAQGEAMHRRMRSRFDEAERGLDHSLCLGIPCRDCGVCPEPGDRLFLVRHPRTPAVDGRTVTNLRMLSGRKATFPSLSVYFDFPESLAGATGEYRRSWFLRRLSTLVRDSWKAVFQVRETLLADSGFHDLVPAGTSLTGRGIVELRGPDAGNLARAASLAGLDVCGMDPATISRISLDIGFPGSMETSAATALRNWLSRSRVTWSERGTGDASGPGILVVPSEAGLKRRVILSAWIPSPGSGGRFSIVAGDRARLADWFAAIGPLASRHARAAVTGFE